MCFHFHHMPGKKVRDMNTGHGLSVQRTVPEIHGKIPLYRYGLKPTQLDGNWEKDQLAKALG